MTDYAIHLKSVIEDYVRAEARAAGKDENEACEEKSTELNKFYGELVKKERYEILANRRHQAMTMLPFHITAKA